MPPSTPVTDRWRPLREGWAAYVALMAFFAVYRVALWGSLRASDSPPFSTRFGQYRWTQVALVSTNDVHLCAAVGVIVALASLALRRAPRWVLLALVAAGAQVLGVASVAHLRLLFTLGAGLDADALAEVAAAGGAADLWSYVEPVDFLLLALPVPLALGLRRLPRVPRQAWDVVNVAFLVVVYAIARVEWHPEPYRRAIWRNPAVHLAFEVRDAAFRRPKGHLAMRRTASERQRAQVLLVDPTWTGEPRPALSLPEKPATNVLLVILESGGARYTHDLTPGADEPMPFLRSLEDRGIHLARHHSSANSSHRSIFSVLTGLYPETGRTQFCIRPDVVVPGLARFMGGDTDRFLYTPGRMTAMFPKGLARNDGFGELVDFDVLAARGVPPWAKSGRHEASTADAFIARMEAAREPFLAVYYSYVAHYWYQDQGPDWRLVPGIRDRYARYLNGLWLLDHLIARMADSLERTGRAQDTVIAVVGDHGQAFGQHPGNWTHPRRTYQENIEVPGVIVVPGAPPAQVDTPTSHVDLLPTLLDALGIPYEPRLLHGESLFRPRTRRMVFAMGSEWALAAVDREGRKARVSWRSDSCSAWDLRRDPGELHKFDCEGISDLRQAIVDFDGLWSAMLPAYNAALREGGTWNGLAHPGLEPPAH